MTDALPRPVVADPRPWTFPEPRRFTLASGLTVLVYDAPGQYVISLRLAIPAHLTGEPAAREGVATIMARCLDEGTRTHDSDQMAELLERKGIALGAGVGEKGLIVELDVPRRTLPDALSVLAEVLTEPAFGEAEVRRHVRTRLAEIDQDYANPTQRAAIEFAATYYPPTDRRSRATAGTASSVGALTREDVAAYHARTVRPEAATLVVAGDLGAFDLDAALASTLGAWSPAPVGPPDRPVTSDDGAAPGSARAADAVRIVIVDRPGSVQSELYVGCPGPSRHVALGWAPYPVLSFVVGGAPNARLDAVLREEKGYTYGVRSQFRPRAGDGLALITGSVRSEVTADALDVLLSILTEARDGFTEAETRAGIDYVVRTAPGRYATADALADEAATRALDGMSTADVTTTLEAMGELTPERLRSAYNAYVNGDFTVVVVGDADQIRASVEALDRGPVSVVADDARPRSAG